VIRQVVNSRVSTFNYDYIYALLLDTEFGLMEGMYPHVLTQCPQLLKSQKQDPDYPTLGEALSGPHREEFLEAMRKEIEELEEHGTWQIIARKDMPAGSNILPSTWALRIKRYPDGRLRKFKARFCARGDKQIEGVDFFDKYAPVVSWSTVRLMLCLATNLGWKTKQVDFSNAFVQAQLKEDVFLTLPACFELPGGEDTRDYVMKLNRSLYGLVQSPINWYSHLKDALEDVGFEKSDHDPCLFYGRGMVLLVYVDDVLFLDQMSVKSIMLLKTSSKVDYLSPLKMMMFITTLASKSSLNKMAKPLR
jgi:hypothetical protein